MTLDEVFMGIPEWEEIAIPHGFGPYRFLYNPPSKTVIIELRISNLAGDASFLRIGGECCATGKNQRE